VRPPILSSAVPVQQGLAQICATVFDVLGRIVAPRWRRCQSNEERSPFGHTSIFEQNPSGSKALPLGQGGRAALFVGLAVDEVAFGSEVVVEAGVDGREFLQ